MEGRSFASGARRLHRSVHGNSALFDFDGTLSLLHAGWADVMVSIMVEELAAIQTGEDEQQLRCVVRE